MTEKINIQSLYEGSLSGERYLDAIAEVLRTSRYIRCSEVAAHLGEDPRKLSAYVEILTGQTLGEMIQLWRALQVRQLIDQGSTLNEEELAHSIGFRNRHSMAETFERHFGKRPYDYKHRRSYHYGE